MIYINEKKIQITYLETAAALLGSSDSSLAFWPNLLFPSVLSSSEPGYHAGYRDHCFGNIISFLAGFVLFACLQ